MMEEVTDAASKVPDEGEHNAEDVTILYGESPFRLTWEVSKEMRIARDQSVAYLASLGAKEVKQIDMKVSLPPPLLVFN